MLGCWEPKRKFRFTALLDIKEDSVKKLADQGLSAVEIGVLLGCSRMTVARRLAGANGSGSWVWFDETEEVDMADTPAFPGRDDRNRLHFYRFRGTYVPLTLSSVRGYCSPGIAVFSMS